MKEKTQKEKHFETFAAGFGYAVEEDREWEEACKDAFEDYWKNLNEYEILENKRTQVFHTPGIPQFTSQVT